MAIPKLLKSLRISEKQSINVKNTKIPDGAWWHTAYGNGTYIAANGDDEPLIIYSKDGNTWFKGTGFEDAPSHDGCFEVAGYGDGVFIAAASTSFYRSENGVNWTKVTVESVSGDPIGGDDVTLAYGNGTFVMVGSPITCVCVSKDKGLSWQYYPVLDGSSSIRGWGCIFSNTRNKFIFIDRDNYRLLESTDGITWTIAGDLGITKSAYNMIEFNGKLILSSSSALLTYDASTLSLIHQEDLINDDGNAKYRNFTIYNNAVYVTRWLTDGFQYLYRSYDGIAWEQVKQLCYNFDITSMVSNDTNQLILLGRDGKVIYGHQNWAEGASSITQGQDSSIDYGDTLYSMMNGFQRTGDTMISPGTIGGVPNPKADDEVANKNYVDTNTIAATDGVGTNTVLTNASIDLASDPSTDMQAATKAYVDNAGGAYYVSILDRESIKKIPQEYQKGKNIILKELYDEYYSSYSHSTEYLYNITHMYGCPTEIVPLEYIECDGRQYIETEYVPYHGTRILMDFQNTKAASHLFGARTAFQDTAFLVCWETNFSYCVQVANGAYNGGSFDISQRHTIEMTGSEFYVDGQLTTTMPEEEFYCSYPLYIGGCSNSDLTTENMVGKIYKMVIQESDSDIAHVFVPARNTLTGDVGLYDLWDQEFYVDASGAGYIAGPEIESSNIKIVYFSSPWNSSIGYCHAETMFGVTCLHWNSYSSDLGGAADSPIYYNSSTSISSTTGYYRPIRVSTAAPTSSDGQVGDIWIQYFN